MVVAGVGSGRRRLSHEHLNLRWNPFREPERSERAALAVVDVAPLVERLQRPRSAVQFLGASGTGKTTHLLALSRSLPGCEYRRADADGRAGRLPPGATLLLDEAQAWSAWRRRRAVRGAGALALGTHEDLRPELERLGFEVATVRLGLGLAARRLRRMVDRRIEWARRGPGPVPVVPDSALEALIARHGSDVRAMEGELYEAVQRLREVDLVQV